MKPEMISQHCNLYREPRRTHDKQNVAQTFKKLCMLCLMASLGLWACTTESGKTTGAVDEEVADEVQKPPAEELNPLVEAFYWYEGTKIELPKSTTYRAVRYSGEPTLEDRQRVIEALNVGGADAELELGRGIFLYKTSAASPPLAGVLPEGAMELTVFVSSSGDPLPLILTEELKVQFKAEVTKQQIDEFNAQNKVSIVRASTWEENGFLLAVQAGAGVDALGMANRYHDSGLVLYAEPNFVQLVQPAFVPNDAFFPQQWALNNTGQHGGVPGADIRAVDAWDITMGSPSITIAILDEGVDYTHPDLNTPGKLVVGYDARLQRDDPNPLDERHTHGTACAGIAAAAANNGIGISGVAPGARIMGIRITDVNPNGQWVSSGDIVAEGIVRAVDRGADVLSNSWYWGYSTYIANAIRYAKNQGRGGRGSVVVASTLNSNGPVTFPATLPEVIGVAACNPWGERKSPTSSDGEGWGSNYGPEVDVCAPGVFIHTTINAGGYRTNFNGTSAAAPHVAGVAALILSVNPDLTATQVEDILRHSATDIAPPGRDDYTGYGMLNALRAVQAATQTLVPGVPECTLTPQTFTLSSDGGMYSAVATCTGSPTSYGWSVNNEVQLESSSIFSYFFPANHTSATQSFVIEVRATNSAGMSSPVSVTLLQPPPPAPDVPICNLTQKSPWMPDSGGARLITANCTHSPTSYSWTLSYDWKPGEEQLPGNESSINYVFPPNNTSTERSFIFTVTATNSAGTSGPVSTIIVQGPKELGPSCSLSPQNLLIPHTGGTYKFEANCTGLPTSHKWTVGGQVQSGTGSSIYYGFPANNTSEQRTFTITVTATNSAGTSSPVSTTYTQQAPPRPPVCTLTSQVSFLPSTGGIHWVRANCTGLSPMSFAWTVDGQPHTGIGNSLSYKFPASTSSGLNWFKIEVKVTNSDGSVSLSMTLPQDPAYKLRAGGELAPGQKLVSPNAQYTLAMQTDGNLVLYASAGKVLWVERGIPGAYATMQDDGNFVLYSPAAAGKALWSTGTTGKGAIYATVQNDGNFVLYTADGKAVWATNTVQK